MQRGPPASTSCVRALETLKEWNENTTWQVLFILIWEQESVCHPLQGQIRVFLNCEGPHLLGSGSELCLSLRLFFFPSEIPFFFNFWMTSFPFPSDDATLCFCSDENAKPQSKSELANRRVVLRRDWLSLARTSTCHLVSWLTESCSVASSRTQKLIHYLFQKKVDNQLNSFHIDYENAWFGTAGQERNSKYITYLNRTFLE